MCNKSAYRKSNIENSFTTIGELRRGGWWLGIWNLITSLLLLFLINWNEVIHCLNTIGVCAAIFGFWKKRWGSVTEFKVPFVSIVLLFVSLFKTKCIKRKILFANWMRQYTLKNRFKNEILLCENKEDDFFFTFFESNRNFFVRNKNLWDCVSGIHLKRKMPTYRFVRLHLAYEYCRYG